MVIPKQYIIGKTPIKRFITNNFTSYVVVTDNKDTVFKKMIGKKDFISVINKQLQDYGTILNPYFDQCNKSEQQIVLQYSISIPVTDIGIGAYLIINKNGNYKVMSDFYYINHYH